MTHEPSSESLLSARLARAFNGLSAYSAATLAEELCRIERAQRKHAERCCSGEDGGYVRLEGKLHPRKVHDQEAEERAAKRIQARCDRWIDRIVALHDRGPVNLLSVDARAAITIDLQGDPRGRVLLLRLPGELEGVGV